MTQNELFFNANQRVGPILQKKYIDGSLYTFKWEQILISEDEANLVTKQKKKVIVKFGLDDSLNLRYLRDEIISRINQKKLERKSKQK